MGRKVGVDDDGVLYGTDHADSIVGSSINDVILGAGGNDKIYGLGGNDLLDGGRGADHLFGGAGDDIFRIKYAYESIDANNSRDVIEDFEAGDKIDISGTAYGPQLDIQFETISGGTRVHVFVEGQSLLGIDVLGVAPTLDNFILPPVF